MTEGAPAVGVLWDTMFASKLRLGRPDVLEAARAQRGTAYEPLLAAPVVAEVVFGFRHRAARDASWWEAHVLAGAHRMRYVGTSLGAAILAARVRALRPASPAKARRSDGRGEERRLSWSRDIELAAIAATSGLPLATENLRDFTVIAQVIAEIAPRLSLDLRDSVVA